MIRYFTNSQIKFDEYVEFLGRSDLGSEYPKKNFDSRIRTLLRHVDIAISARSKDGTLVGVCLGLTDFAYFLYLTDLGVDRDYERQGIGSTMIKLAHEQAGGDDDICMITWCNEAAMPFYESCGLKRIANGVAKEATDWKLFTVPSTR